MERIVNTSGINLNANYEGNLTDDILIIFKFVFQFELNFLNFFFVPKHCYPCNCI